MTETPAELLSKQLLAPALRRDRIATGPGDLMVSVTCWNCGAVEATKTGYLVCNACDCNTMYNYAPLRDGLDGVTYDREFAATSSSPA
jgi:hypothetical protein